MKKVELLAPAGNYQALVGALNAGADAVYLGGDRFGARAYADNFTEEEICKAIRYAHILGRKIYLTVNTLVKEKEFSSLFGYLSPLYEAGLDGVIIQDLGVWQYIKETFPDMALHASTQMTVTGRMGASFLKEIGAARIVPARELSLTEITEIKEQTGLELECFIHGAMCYCYSGQCLFSSILGGRSGNRGRCAQPCRLPYKVSADTASVSGDEGFYPLSLKDMCTMEFIPKLIEAGIDSFKIEGRMKKPEYAAGVTAVYRKYIDLYYQYGADSYQVLEYDLEKLKKLYIRSEIQTGYYERANGREMVTLREPGYLSTDEALLLEIAEQYMQEEQRVSATLKGLFHTGQAAMLQIDGEGVSQTSYGEIVQKALKQPMTKESVLKHLRKTGSSHIQITVSDITVDADAFMPVGQLNELRRCAVTAFENKLIEAHGLTHRRMARMQDCPQDRQKEQYLERNLPNHPQLHVAVQNLEQLQAACQYPCSRIYIDADYYIAELDQVSQVIKRYPEPAIFLSLPYVVRNRDLGYFQHLVSLLRKDGDNRIKGFLARNLESVSWLRSTIDSFGKPLPDSYEIVTDAGLYCFNEKAARFLHLYSEECYLPYELNGKECRQLMSQGIGKMSMVVYGTIPMMLSANCIRKTTGHCSSTGHSMEKGTAWNRAFLTDRYHKTFPVLCNCKHCFNVIYNSVPYSLHQSRKELEKLGLFAMRLDFIWEDGRQAERILDYYTEKSDLFPITEYTAGHYKRGVE